MKTNTLQWGILGVARVATGRILPAIPSTVNTRIAAIASRDSVKARDAAERFGIPRAHGSYEDLLADPEVQAVYIPLPNHLHLPWIEKAAQAGKHILCEKPIAMNAPEVERMIQLRDTHRVKICEAFMVRQHPRWQRAHELVRSGRIGQLRAISGFFTIPFNDAANIRFNAAYGGGALMDLGCYQIHLARWLFGEEPTRVHSIVDRHPSAGIDRLTSLLLECPSGHASFTCAFESVWAQSMTLLGTTERIDIEPAVGPPADQPTLLRIGKEIEEFAPCNQYALLLDAFARSVFDNTPEPITLEDSLGNARALDLTGVLSA